jgi:hypothetical protein
VAFITYLIYIIKMNDSEDENRSVVILGQPKLIDVTDLVNLIADFCDDQTLSKLSRVSSIVKDGNRLAKGSER